MKILKQLFFKANLTLYLNYRFLGYPSVMSDSLQPHRLYSPQNSPGQNTGVGSLSLLQGIFPTQGSNWSLSNCRWILYQLSHRGSPRILEWVAYPFSSGSCPPRNQTRASCIASGFFTNWAIREAKPCPMLRKKTFGLQKDLRLLFLYQFLWLPPSTPTS